MHGLASAIRFLTVIPVGRGDWFDARSALPFFPLAGLLIGVCVAGVDALAAQLWPAPAAALVDVVALAAITGALHLDGLADAADGLYGNRPPEQALAIMKDSRIGAMGMVVVVCCLALKWAGLAGIGANRMLWMLIVVSLARSTALFGIKFLPYGRAEGGTGRTFFQNPLRFVDFWGVGLIALLSLCAGWRAVVVLFSFGLLLMAVLAFYRRRIGCITGDMLGALIETTEAGLFMIIAAWSS